MDIKTIMKRYAEPTAILKMSIITLFSMFHKKNDKAVVVIEMVKEIIKSVVNDI